MISFEKFDLLLPGDSLGVPVRPCSWPKRLTMLIDSDARITVYQPHSIFYDDHGKLDLGVMDAEP
jgi:hypothetical protein